MPISESMVKDIVQEVMAKMQLADAPSGKLGIFKDMNEAIEAAKKAQKVVRNMSLDQREKNHFRYPPENPRERGAVSPPRCG